ncbi:MAG: SRPBCC family protein [Caulobacter sp.]|nr:SRPBCC family protein [Caulobacter sp.]
MMRTGVTAALIALTLAASSEARVPDAAAGFPAAEPWVSVTLDADGESARIRAGVDIPAAPDRVWATMTDCAATRRMIKSLVECRITRSGDGWDIREHLTRGGPLWPSFHYVFRSDYEVGRRIRFRKLEGNLKTFEGEWGLAPRNGGRSTRVTYETRVSAAIFAPAILIRAGLRRDTPKVLEIMRRLVTEG